MYEVTLSIQRLVNKFGNELWDPTWSIILAIIEQIIIHAGKIYWYRVIPQGALEVTIYILIMLFYIF